MNALKFDFLFSCQTVPLAQSNKSSRQRNIWTQILSRWYQVSLQRLSLWEPQIKEGIQQENNRHIACITYCLVFRHIMEQEIYLYKRNNLQHHQLLYVALVYEVDKILSKNKYKYSLGFWILFKSLELIVRRHHIPLLVIQSVSL